MSKRTDLFISQVSGGAMSLWGKFKILPSVAIGQAILESAWGMSSLAIKYNNLFGIKGEYKGNSAMLNTWEVYGGKRYDIKAGFRVYPDWETSILDYGAFLKVNKRYSNALGLRTFRNQIKEIHKAGYATDPDYANKVISIITKYKLDRYDKMVLEPLDLSEKPKQKTTTYTVKSGDTLFHIARKYQSSINYLMDLNKEIKDPDIIYVGQVLTVPDSPKKYYVVGRGDTLTHIAKKYNTTVDNLVKLNNIGDPDRIYVGQRLKLL